MTGMTVKDVLMFKTFVNTISNEFSSEEEFQEFRQMAIDEAHREIDELKEDEK